MHFMALAPIDVWLRLLFRPLARVQPKYWPRLGVVLFSSILATLVTLPERMVLGLWLKLTPHKPEKLPGPVFVLGHYRSGTTHLHYLLDCDPQLFTPKWFHALAPQGFVGSWSFLRMFLIPFMSGSRPMDAMDVGPEYAAEDHFGVANWCGASTLIGKTAFPQMADHYDRYNLLRDVTDEELGRWKTFQLAFIRKMALLAGGRRLLLKSPSHTSHVDRLLEVLEKTPGVKFIHIARQPDKVLQSNVWMHQIFQRTWNVQDAQTPREMEDNLLKEYVESEASFLACRDRIPPGCLAQMRMQDLQADPLGEIRRVYGELGLDYSPEFERRMIVYLDATRNFRPNKHAEFTPEQRARLAPKLEHLKAQFGHDRPTIAKVETPAAPPVGGWDPAVRRKLAYVAVAAAAVLCAAVWAPMLKWAGDGYPQWLRLVWPAGLALGFTAHWVAGKGSKLLGAWTVLGTAALLVFASYYGASLHFFNGEVPTSAQLWQATFFGFDSTSPHGPLLGVFSFHALFWAVVGGVSAYRLGCRE